MFIAKAPEPKEPWSPAVIDAFEHGPICLQPSEGPLATSHLQSEDCLLLNIYVPGKKTIFLSRIDQFFLTLEFQIELASKLQFFDTFLQNQHHIHFNIGII